MAKSPESSRLGKREYEARVPDLRAALVQMQVALQQADFPVLFVVAGEEAAGKGDLVNILNAWLDPRGVETYAFHTPTDEERERPAMWRYWRCLPPRGRMAIYAGSWYTEAMREDPRGAEELLEFDRKMRRIAHFESLLAADGALIVKVWLQLSQDAQRTRLRELEADPDTAWRVTPEDWKYHREYEHFAQLGERLRRATHKPGGVWHLIPAADPRTRNLLVADYLLARFRVHQRTHKKAPPRQVPRRVTPLRASGLRRLLTLPLDQELTNETYEAKRDKWLGRLNPRRARRGGAGAFGRMGFRGLGCSGKRRRDPPPYQRARCPRLPGHPHLEADRRRAGAPLPLALLAVYSARGLRHNL